MNPEACYFYFKEKKGETFMAVVCPECHDEKHLNIGRLYEDGFGHAHDVVCDICNKVIRKGPKEENGKKEKD
jgi:ribosomal protein S27E